MDAVLVVMSSAYIRACCGVLYGHNDDEKGDTDSKVLKLNTLVHVGCPTNRPVAEIPAASRLEDRRQVTLSPRYLFLELNFPGLFPSSRLEAWSHNKSKPIDFAVCLSKHS